MAAALGLVLLLPAVSGGWSAEIHAPASAPEGLPFPIEVCASAEGRGQLRVLAENASLDVREDRYLAPFDAGECRALLVVPEGGIVELEARVRPEAGGSAKARATARVEIARAAGELRILDAWAKPFEGVVLFNAGEDTARLELRALDGERLPAGELLPGEIAFVGPSAPPGTPRHVAFDVNVRNSTMQLTVGARVESSLAVPKLRAGWSTSGMYGRTNVSATTFDIREVEAFATPGATPLPALIDEAREEVLVESHTFTSADVAAALLRALDRGARVRVLLEGAPPGGVPPDERGVVATLQARGAEVLLLGGEGARYRTMHAKLVVVDRAAVAVATENLNEGSSRGYGLIVRDPALARMIAAVMDSDTAPWHDVHPAAFADPPAEIAASVLLPSPSSLLPASKASVVLSPDEPDALARVLARANASVDVEMLRAESDARMIGALVEAAQNGARVRLLLDGRFDDGVNRETVAKLTALALRDNLSLEAKLDAPRRTLHAKSFVVDGTTSYVGSMNWVRAAWEDNREAGLLVESHALAAWLTQEFEKDWEEEVEAPPRADVPAHGWLVIVALALSRRLPRARARRA